MDLLLWRHADAEELTEGGDDLKRRLTARGELLPAWIQIQREAVKYADAELGMDSLDAEVLEINEGVRRFNKRNGFTELETQNREIGGENVAVIHVRRERPRTDRQEPTS